MDIVRYIKCVITVHNAYDTFHCLKLEDTPKRYNIEHTFALWFINIFERFDFSIQKKKTGEQITK